MVAISHQQKVFKCQIEGIQYSGLATYSGRYLRDYIVICTCEDSPLWTWKFELKMVSTPPLYCVNAIRAKCVTQHAEQLTVLNPRSAPLAIAEAFEFGMNAVHQLVKEQRESFEAGK